MKCVITGNETNTLTNGLPLSRDGRIKLNEITERYNTELKEQFKKRFKEKTNDNEEAAEGIAKVMAPKCSKKKMLKMLTKNTEEEIFKPFEEAAVEKGDSVVTVTENGEYEVEAHATPEVPTSGFSQTEESENA